MKEDRATRVLDLRYLCPGGHKDCQRKAVLIRALGMLRGARMREWGSPHAHPANVGRSAPACSFKSAISVAFVWRGLTAELCRWCLTVWIPSWCPRLSWSVLGLLLSGV